MGHTVRHACSVSATAAILLLTGTARSQNCMTQPPDADFITERLVAGSPTGDAMDLDISKDGRVFWVERTTKKLQVYLPGTKTVQVIHTFSPDIVMSENTLFEGNGNEGGLQGIALDGNFAQNHFVYLFYTARVPDFPKGSFNAKERLSRFTLTENDTKLDLNSEAVLLEFTIYAQCCHNGGDIEWGPDGNLWLTTGDNTSLTYNSDGVPINDANPKLDARTGTANTNSLRGKIIRIKPTAARQADGKWYTIPEGNLFPPGTALALPEIYSMGHRNPFSIALDPRKRGDGKYPWVLVGEAGPALGTDEVNLIKQPGFFGWPFLNRNNFSMGSSAFTPNAIVNNSSGNTGMKNLPVAQGAIAWYGQGGNSGHGIGGCVPGAGPFMNYDSSLNSTSKFPPWFNDKVILFAGWGGSFWVARMTDQGTLADVKSLFTNRTFGNTVLRMKRGPDGALYTISNGGGFFVPGSADKIWRIAYGGNCNPPVKVVERIPARGVLESRPLLARLGTASMLDLPEGVRSLHVVDSMGKVVWTHRRDGNLEQSILPAPSHLVQGVYSIRYSL